MCVCVCACNSSVFVCVCVCVCVCWGGCMEAYLPSMVVSAWGGAGSSPVDRGRQRDKHSRGREDSVGTEEV